MDTLKGALAPAEAKSPSFLDRAVLAMIRWDGEKLAWVVLLIIALLSRTIGLGDRVMSHDESLHTVYSWQLYDGRGYQHQPMMHGPLKFILNAAMYFLFGVNDWSARIQVALFGVLMVGLVWLMRRWLGRTGAFLTATMFAISPALLYYSRYIRDEVMLCALLVLLVITMFRYLETRSAAWLVGTAVTLGLAFTTMEASFIFGGLFGIFLVLALAAQLWAAEWPQATNGGRAPARTDARGSYRLLVALALPLLAVGLLAIIFKLKTAGFALVALGAAAAVLAVLLVAINWRMRLRAFAELDLIVLLLMLVLPFLSAVVLKALGWQISQFNNPGQITLSMVWQGFLVLAVLFLVSIAIGWFWLRGRWFMAAGAFWAIEILLFTTFLTNGQGIGTGLIGSLGYWIDQQEVMRGGQPWYYFWLLVPLYEFLPLVLSIGGMVAWVLSWRLGAQPAPEPSRQGAIEPGAAVAADPDGETRSREGRGPRRGEGREARRSAGREPARPLSAARPDDRATIVSTAGYARASSSADVPVIPPFTVQRLFEAFLVFWVLGTWAVFTYVGEKMAWHTVYFATSLAVLGGWWLGKVVDGIDWKAGRQRGIVWLMAMVPLALLVLKALLPTSDKRPFANVTINGLSHTVQWVLALVVGLVLVYFLYDRIAALGARQSVRAIAVSLMAILAIFTVAVSYRFSFINYDYATEPMVYAHGTPDLKLAMAQLEELSRKTVGDHAIKVAYDDDSTWPLEWYLRDYPKKAYFGASPSRDAVDAPVVIVGDKNLSKVRPYLGDRYYEFNYRLVWWPRETYKGLSWQRIRDGLRDPRQRGQFWDVVIHRRYSTPTAQWDPIHRFSMFVRKDVAAQVWDWGVPAAAAAGPGGPVADPYAGGQRTVTAVQQIGMVGMAGAAPGQFNQPRALTVGPDGKIYVADTGNNRIQVLNADGSFLRQWGSTCRLYQNRQGCQGDGQGQFDEPWGIAVDAEGNVYVADTFNYRIQKFSPEGRFLQMWGSWVSTGGELGQTGVFYGPRQLVFGQDGNLYVTDTGNKRIQVFRPDGAFVAQFGGGGVVEGRFDEPTGLAQDAAGNWYVADTWNRRIQKLNSTFGYVAQWPINGWAGQSVVNKPQLAVDPVRNLIYATDPENYRVLVFNPDGSFRATFGQYGNDAQTFMLPTGIAVGPDGRVYVADSDAHRIMVFPPLQ